MARDTYESKIGFANSYIPPPRIPNYAPHMCEIFHYSYHESNSYPHYISYEGFARLSSMIKAMNKQQIKFANKIREYDLSHETDLRFNLLDLMLICLMIVRLSLF